MSHTPSIEFECTYCLTRVSAPATQCGNEMECPVCHTKLIVPSRSIDLKLFNDIFESLNPTVEPAADEAFQEIVNDEIPVEILDAPERVDASVESTKPSPTVPRKQTTNTKSKPPAVRDESEPPSRRSPDASPAAEPVAASSRQPEPVVVDPEPAALVIEGLDDTEISKVLGIKCNVCETRIHVNESEIGSKIECPICFTHLRLTAQENAAKSNPRWTTLAPDRDSMYQAKMFGDEALELSPPIDRPPVEFPVDPTFGLEPVTEDLLAPSSSRYPSMDVPDTHADSSSDLQPGRNMRPRQEIVDSDSSNHSSNTNPKSGSRRQKTRRELYEASQQRQLEKENHPKRRWSGTPTAKSKSKPKAGSDSDPPTFGYDDNNDAIELETTVAGYAQIAVEVLNSPGLRWRAVAAMLLIGIGGSIMHFIASSYRSIDDPQFGEWILNTLLWLGFGGVPCLLGTLLLWFVCGYVFRATAQGECQVSNWETAGTSDLTSTFLIFSFSFFIAGLPMAFFSLLVTPFRFLLAPPLLLSAWFHQSPFAIVAVDAFQNFATDWRHWRSFYSFALILAGVSLITGLLLGAMMWLAPFFVVATIASLASSIILVLLTIAFAAATGWHCGQVVRDL